MYFKQEIGRNGESLAEAYLRLLGYEILEKNFRCFRGEVDLIATDNSQIIFIEIKSRHSKEYGLASEAVTKEKLKHIYKTAEYYLVSKKLENNDVRIDVIEIYIGEDECYINYLKQVI